MNILSLFDGMACGRVALERAGILVEHYYASEVDKYAMAVAKKNHPDIIHVGDVTRWREWDFDFASIDLLIGGSPCQGFSFAGKQLNFEDPRSKLFFEYVDILKHIKERNPDVLFLLENVRMKKEYSDVISRYLETDPIMINSALVSAQNRKRLYWTNIEGVEQPDDKGILLKDIIHETTERTYAIGGGRGAKTGLHLFVCITPDRVEKRQNGQRFFACEKFYTLTAQDRHGVLVEGYIRRLTPIECERLQTLPDGYTDAVLEDKKISDSQRYKMLGNGWTVDVVAHILKYINKKTGEWKKMEQMTMKDYIEAEKKEEQKEEKKRQEKRVKHEIINDNFQNFKRYNIPKAQLVIADIPYNIGNNFYGSNPMWYKDGDSKNGESKLAGKAAFNTDFNFNIAEYFHFCNKLLKKEPKNTNGRGKSSDAPCMIVFCSFQQMQTVIEYAKKHGFKNYIPLYFIKNYSPQVLKANMRVCGAVEHALLLYRDKLPKFRNGLQVDENGKNIRGTGKMIFNWFNWERDGKEIPKIHPAQKPVALLKRLIVIFTDVGDVVIDPCCGSGSTIQAAKEMQRSAYGFEISKDFYNRAKTEMLQG